MKFSSARSRNQRRENPNQSNKEDEGKGAERATPPIGFIYGEKERTWLLWRGFGAKSFPLKFDIRQIKWKIHFARVSLYYIKGIEIKKLTILKFVCSCIHKYIMVVETSTLF